MFPLVNATGVARMMLSPLIFSSPGFSGGECSGAFSSAFFQATQVQPQMDGVNAHKEIFKF